MKRLLTTPITDSVGFPPKAGTWEFLQDAVKEAADALARALPGKAYSNAKMYIIHGLDYTEAGGNWTMTAGAVYYNGEIYLVPGVTLPIIGGQFPVLNVDATQFFTDPTADPVEFTDNNDYNVHNIRQILVTNGTSLTGTPYGDCIRLLSPYVRQSTLTSFSGPLSIDFSGHQFIKVNGTSNTGGVISVGGTFQSQRTLGARVQLMVEFGSSPATLQINSGVILVYQSSGLTIGDIGMLAVPALDVTNKKIYLDMHYTSQGLEVKIYEYTLPL